jgi:glycosyltransferase involved in cell wall biosynthesis
MIILLPDTDSESRSVIQSFNEKRVIFHEYKEEDRYSIGALRNMSVEKSNGRYLCQWDDDDWYHPSRIEMQLQALISAQKKASVLAYHLIYDETQNTAYTSPANPWPQTIMFSADLFEKHTYPDISLREDELFVRQLIAANHVVPIAQPSLYIYVYHGGNTCNTDHFQFIFSNSNRLPVEISNLIRGILQQSHSPDIVCSLIDSQTVLEHVSYFPADYKRDFLKRNPEILTTR